MTNALDKLIPATSRPESVGPRITAIREALSLTKSEFADAISYDRSTLTKVEKGATGLDIAVGVRIATLYGIGLDFIYRGDLADVPSPIRTALLNELARLTNG